MAENNRLSVSALIFVIVVVPLAFLATIIQLKMGVIQIVVGELFNIDQSIVHKTNVPRVCDIVMHTIYMYAGAIFASLVSDILSNVKPNYVVNFIGLFGFVIFIGAAYQAGTPSILPIQEIQVEGIQIFEKISVSLLLGLWAGYYGPRYFQPKTRGVTVDQLDVVKKEIEVLKTRTSSGG